jgi:hypothetical protein
MKKLLITCLSLVAIVLSSGASHAGLSLDRCSPFFAVSYHGNIDTDFNETHPGVKCDWDENKTISVIRNSYDEPALIFTYQKDTHGKWGYMAGAAFGYRDRVFGTGSKLIPKPSFGITYKLNSRMMIYGAPTGFQGDYIIGMKNLYSNNKNSGGGYRNRTGVHGFAIRCVTTPPTRRRLMLCYTMI